MVLCQGKSCRWIYAEGLPYAACPGRPFQPACSLSPGWRLVAVGGGAACTVHPILTKLCFLFTSQCSCWERAHYVVHERVGKQLHLLILAIGTARIIRPVCALRGGRCDITQSRLILFISSKGKEVIPALCCSFQCVLNEQLSIFLRKTSRFRPAI